MRALVFDTDGLIKLTRTEIVEIIPLPCFIPQEVFEEAVIEGKKRLYEDAFQIENMINRKRIIVKKVEKRELLAGFGKGESATLALYFQEKASAIVSDDKKFVAYLQKRNIPFIIPTEVIVGLVHKKKLEKSEGEEALAKIKPFVREENYNYALEALGGKP